MNKIICSIILQALILYCGSSKNRADKQKDVLEQKVSIYGKVEVYNKDEIYIVERWKTRSRISYKLIDANDRKVFYSKNGRIVKVEAIILERKNPWSGAIKIKKIIEEQDEKEGKQNGD